MKQTLLNLLRQVHMAVRKPNLPDRIAIYYHELSEAQLASFSEGIRHLVAQGYVSVNAREYVAEDGPEKRLFISFDDNFKDWHKALNVFADLGVTCTFYVTSGVFSDRSTKGEQETFMERIGQPTVKETLTTAQLREIVARGHTIGCHTHTHHQLSSLPESKWDREIAHSKKVLERLTDTEIVDFSFPFGMRRDFGDTLEAYCRGLGFETIATGISGQLYRKATDPFHIHRTGWKFHLPLSENLKNLQLDARLYANLFGRSVIG